MLRSSASCCIGGGIGCTTTGGIVRGRGRRGATVDATVQVLVTLQVFLLHARHIVLQLFDDALLAGKLILHLLQLHEQLALCRGRGRSP
ncbi:hypothetical protein D9M73_215590 [compost metagenome]